MPSAKPILITGSPRSGTSWIGRIIEHVPFIRYVHEPFNISGRPCRCGVHFPYWFHYVSARNIHEFDEHLKHILYPAYSRVALLNLITETVQSRKIRPILKYLRAYRYRKVLMKDPLAVFSAETLASQFNMDVVVIIRHPAAIVSSYKALQWTHPFSHFVDQPELMDEHLGPFRAEIEDFAKNEYDIIDQSALLWKLIHSMIMKYQKIHPDWIFIRHEDLACDPIEGYRMLFDRLDLPYSEAIRRAVHAHSLQTQLSDTTRPYTVSQNSVQVTSKWRKFLTAGDITRIRKRVDDVASHFYSNDEWFILLTVYYWFNENVSMLHI